MSCGDRNRHTPFQIECIYQCESVLPEYLINNVLFGWIALLQNNTMYHLHIYQFTVYV